MVERCPLRQVLGVLSAGCHARRANTYNILDAFDETNEGIRHMAFSKSYVFVVPKNPSIEGRSILDERIEEYAGILCSRHFVTSPRRFSICRFDNDNHIKTLCKT